MLIPNYRLVQHYKGGWYLILELDAKYEWAPGKECVIYQSLQDGQIWIRDKSEFFGSMVKLEDGTEVKRFKILEPTLGFKQPKLCSCQIPKGEVCQ